MAHTAPNLYKLMDMAEKGQLVLPNFQRRFIWTRQQVEELLESVIAGYFMGTFLFLNVRPNDAPFSPMLVEGVSEVMSNVKPKPESMILDGQQRVTSLFYALYSPEISLRGTKYPYRFYLELRKALNKEFDEAVFSYRWDWNYYEDAEIQFEEAIVPFTKLASLESFEDWLRGYQKYQEGFGKLDYREVDGFRKIRQGIGDYQIDVISLSQNDFETYEIVEIFERVNSTGTPLSVFELLTSRFYQFEINLRKMWEDCYENLELVKQFSGELTNEKFPRYILQIIALSRGINPKKKNLFDLNEVGFAEDWKTSSDYLEKALSRLSNIKKGGYGVRVGWVPYATMIPPLAVLLLEIEKRGASAEYYNKLHKWYWASIFSNWYERSTDTRAFNDVIEITSWFGDGKEVPSVINNLELGEIELRERAQKGGAIYQGVISLILLKGANDFFLDDTIELHELDDHHIFPIAYLKKKGIEGDEVNNILNRTLIASRTNRRINKTAPSVYLSDMTEELGSESKVKQVLKTHFINAKAYAAMKNDDYDKFLEAREEEITKEIKKRAKP
jgi:hypothetical protein